MTWISWPLRFTAFWLWFGKELVASNFTVLHDNLTRGQHSTPGIARYVTRCRTEAEATLLASLITLTPGTLTIGTTLEGHDGRGPGTRVLFVHGMYAAGADALRADLRRMETRMLHALRRKGAPS